MNEEPRIKMMTIRQLAETGILPEHTIRTMVKGGQIPHIKAGNRALVNYYAVVDMLIKTTGGTI